MGSYRYLFKNIGLLTLSNFGTKLLTFFLVPLYTYVLSTEEYGVYDLFNSTVSLLVPLLTLNICEAVLRFSLEASGSNHKETVSYGLWFVGISSAVVALVIVGNHFLWAGNMLDTYGSYFFFMYLSTAFLGVINNFARGIDCVLDVSIGGILGSLTMILLNVVFLLPCHLGLKGYFLAHIIGALIQAFFLFFRTNAYSYFTTSVNHVLLKSMLLYSIPLIANSIGWWINNVSDRYVVTLMCGVAVTGIYSVAYKIPSILDVFQSIFSQAWVLSAVKEFDPHDEDGFFRKIYGLYSFSMIIICATLIAMSRVLAHFLYAKEFYAAWEYVPFLLVSVVFGAMAGYIGGVFSAVKNSKIYASSTSIGAGTNIILNLLLIHYFGALGAAIATAISYWIVWAIRMWHVKAYMSVCFVDMWDYFSYGLLVAQSFSVIGMRNDNQQFLVVQLAFIVIQLFLHRKAVKYVLDIVGKKLRK